ncbi:MAG: Gfo/Idh/MocA family oxidoreductase [Planctomycetes bacterium]|nr:Gfo/Idh/MocA family oxidoreductase [Planctomycetota bacterium]
MTPDPTRLTSDPHRSTPGPHPARSVDRRQFIQASAVTLAAATLTRPLTLFGASREEPIRVGLVGCGGRGTGAAVNALLAEEGAVLVAMGDAFSDRLESSLSHLQSSEVASRVKVEPDHRFTGFDAYRDVIARCDVVLLATPPHFRPAHVEAAVEAGVHIFAEKPVATDAPGLRRCWAAVERAKEKGLTLVSGLCYRYDAPKQETIGRIRAGDIGEIVALQCTYNTGALWHHGRQPDWSDMEWQLRNWLYFNWLSGDHITEQSIHSIDKILWAMDDVPPAKATASGGRIVRTDPKYGNVFDHFNTVFEWENGVRGFHSCRQWSGADGEVSDYAFGTKGVAAIQHHRIDGVTSWRYRGKSGDMYVAEHEALFDSIRHQRARNDGDYMCKSTLMALMARMSAYTGKSITWEQALHSEEDLTPPSYEWVALPIAPVAQPGRTPFV